MFTQAERLKANQNGLPCIIRINFYFTAVISGLRPSCQIGKKNDALRMIDYTRALSSSIK